MATPVGLPPGFVLDDGLPAEPTTADVVARMGRQPAAGLPDGFELDAPDDVSVLADVGESAVRGANKGLFGLATLPYEGMRYLLDQGISIPNPLTGGTLSASPGIKLPAAEDMPLYRPFLKQPEPKTAAGRFAGAAGEAVGSSVLPAMGIMGKAKQVTAVSPSIAQRLVGANPTAAEISALRAEPSLAQSFLRPIAENPGFATSIDAVSAVGSGLARQAAADANAGPLGETVASLAGGIATPMALVSGARGVRAAGEAAWDAFPKMKLSADGAEPMNAARERATQMIADQLTKAGVSRDEIERRIADIDWARVFQSSGQAQDPMTLADLDESLARLLGAAVRQQPEAANTARGFLYARQTGLEPEKPLHRGAGIPTREALSEPITGKEAHARFGTDYGAGQKNLVPTGQHERVVDALKRAFSIKDADFHGHAANANRTDDQIVLASKELSAPAYNAAYKAGNGVDLQPHLAPVLQKWAAIAARDGDEPIEVQRLINGLLRRFGSVANIRQFDKNKQFGLDAAIDRAFKSMEGRNRYVGGRLSELKDDLLAAVDAVEANNVGPLYKSARDVFSSHADARRVLQMGRDAFGEESDIGIDAFNALTSKGDQKLFRLGYLGAVEKKSASQGVGADRTKMFANPRQQKLLAGIIERSDRDSAVFADRPQRFGGYLADEGRMVRTKETVSGNSKTAEREADDLAFDTLHTIMDVFKDPRLLSIGKRGLELAFNKAFGIRADAAAELAQLLLTAEPGRRAQILRAVQQQMGSSRFQRFSDIMTEYQRQSITGTLGGAAASVSTQGSQQ
jgi:hypothetical protein